MTATPVDQLAAVSVYRPDIDGMRAIAVLSVIAFHINKYLLPGGFVGVDIFFVISGYLISAHIFAAIARGKFSFIDFYFRRVRRIAPAMLVVLFVTVLAAEFLLLPDEARAAAKSSLMSLVSLTNVYFWLFQDRGYFAAASSELPLLHLWSLSVEEQFYLIWPIAAVAMAGFRYKNKLALLIGIIIISTSLAQLSFIGYPAFAYYMLPSRSGELLIGAVLALAVVHGHTARIASRCALTIAWSGLFLVVLSAVFITENMVFPGVMSLPPTIGAALLILAGGMRTNFVSRVLSIAPVRWIGTLSYPAYLWHWPLLAFYRYGYGEPDLVAGVVVLILTFSLAWLTVRFVERPARRVPLSRYVRGFAAWAACSAGVAVVATAFAYSDRLLPDSYNWAYHRQLDAAREQNRSQSQADYICQRKALHASDLDDAKCVLGGGVAPASRILLLGDSNAAHFVGMVSEFAQRAQFRFRNLTVGSCPPIFGDVSTFVPSARQKACTDSHKVWKTAVAEADILIIGGTWNEYQQTSAKFLPMLEAQIREFSTAGKTVIILGKIPVIVGFDRLCQEKAIRYPLMHCDGGMNQLPEDVANINAKLRRFASETPNVRYFDVEAIICPDAKCSVRGITDENLYFDKHHLSVAGSRHVGQAILSLSGMPAAFSFRANLIAQ